MYTIGGNFVTHICTQRENILIYENFFFISRFLAKKMTPPPLNIKTEAVSKPTKLFLSTSSVEK